MNRKEFMAMLFTSAVVACKHEVLPPAINSNNNDVILKKIDLRTELLNVGDIVTDTVKGIYVKRIASGNVVASFTCYSLACTHSGCITVLQGNGEFHCPCHGSKFSNDGTVINGPAARPLDRFTIEVTTTELLVKL